MTEMKQQLPMWYIRQQQVAQKTWGEIEEALASSFWNFDEYKTIKFLISVGFLVKDELVGKSIGLLSRDAIKWVFERTNTGIRKP